MGSISDDDHDDDDDDDDEIMNNTSNDHDVQCGRLVTMVRQGRAPVPMTATLSGPQLIDAPPCY